MNRRKLTTLLVCALAVLPSSGLPLAFALASPALAQTPRDDGATIAAEAKDAATQLQAYLDGVVKSGGRPEFSKPPASDLLGQVFNLNQLEALPPAQGGDLPWLLDWIAAANGVNKSIMFFGHRAAGHLANRSGCAPAQRHGLRGSANGGDQFSASHLGARIPGRRSRSWTSSRQNSALRCGWKA